MVVLEMMVLNSLANTSRQRTDESHWCLAQSGLPLLRFAVGWLLHSEFELMKARRLGGLRGLMVRSLLPTPISVSCRKPETNCFESFSLSFNSEIPALAVWSGCKINAANLSGGILSLRSSIDPLETTHPLSTIVKNGRDRANCPD